MKKLLILAIVLCVCLNVFSQATSLTVDNQTPGWLSSKINYGDQQSVIDLTITGYLNTTDLEFVGTLMKNHSLKRLDLEQADIVSSNPELQDVLTLDVFKIDIEECHLEKIVLPLSIKRILQDSYVNKLGCFSNTLYVDTLVMGGPAMPVIQNSVYGKRGYGGTSFGSRVKCLILRNGVESIADECFYSSGIDNVVFSKVVLPSSLKSIGIRSLSRNNFTSIDLPESIEEIGMDAFRVPSSYPETLWRPDTIILPSCIKSFNISAFNSPSKVYYFPESINFIDNKGRSTDYTTQQDLITRDMFIEIHLKCSTPPNSNYNSSNFLKNSVIYVPKGSSGHYTNTAPWKYATIIEEIYVEGVSLAEIKDIHVGDKTKLQVTILPADATNKKVKWETSNTDVATISEEGLLTAVSGGKVTITATTDDGGYQATCEVNVYEHTTGVQMVDKITMYINDHYELNAQTLPLYTSDGKINYSSNNTNIATISPSGNITAMAKGTCTITATSVDGGYTAECVVTVLQPVESVTLEQHNIAMKVGDTANLYALVAPSTADNKTLIWSSSDEEVATVDEKGNITALKGGTVTIKVVSEDNQEATDVCTVFISQPVTGIAIDKPTITLEGIGATAILTSTIIPDNASNTEVKWTSSNESVCIVSNGTVVAVGEGTCVIIVTTEDGGYIATCTVTVAIPNSISTPRSVETPPFKIFDVNGVERKTLLRGINIIRFDDGTMKKVFVKRN